MHRIADPQDLGAHRFYGTDHVRQMVLHRFGAESMDQRQATRFIVRIQNVHDALQPLAGHPGSDLHADRIRNAAEILDVRAVELRRSHADPREVGRQVIPALAALQVTGLRLFVVQVQAFVSCIDIGPLRTVELASRHGFEEIQRVRN